MTSPGANSTERGEAFRARLAGYSVGFVGGMSLGGFIVAVSGQYAWTAPVFAVALIASLAVGLL